MIWFLIVQQLSGCHWGTNQDITVGTTGSGLVSDSASPFELQNQPASLIERPLVDCLDPEAWKSEGRLFEGDLGADWLVQPDGAHDAPELMNSPGYGLAVADFNGDGRMDIFLPNIAPNQLFLQGEGFVFDEVAEKAGIQAPDDPSEGAVAADVDGDGDQDIVVFNRGVENRLYINDGHAKFTQLDAFSLKDQSITGAFGDYDGDGDLDLVVGNRDEQTPEAKVPDDNVLLENLGGLVFSNVSDLLPTTKESEYTYVVSWLDIDDDTLPELFIFNDGGAQVQSNRLLKYVDGLFEDISEQYQFAIHMSSMGASFGDINKDQKPDIVVSNLGGELLLESIDDGSWIETDAVRGLLHTDAELNFPYVTWGIEFADIDHDLDLDVVMTAGSRLKQVDKSEPWNQPDAIFSNERGKYESVGDEWGFNNENNNRGLAVVDLNEDGFLDFIVRSVDNHTQVLMQRCTEKNWLKVSLQQDGANRDAIGAKVILRHVGGPQERYVMAGGTSLSTSLPAQVHFGLDDVEAVYKLQVQWPDGASSTFRDVAVNQHVTVVRDDHVTQTPY